MTVKSLETKDEGVGSILYSPKLKGHHLERLAVVYVRQSTPRQVEEHRESTALQYNLARRAVGLGWPDDRVLVIDDDLGQSGASAEHRQGFQRILAEVGLNHVGMVLGIEMSRLARSCKDWYQLLELCAVFDVLLADQDGLYDPGEYNDRLLLGLKGTMSEAELHILRGRLDQGRRHKAERGDLFSHLPVGYVRMPGDEVGLDPDEQAQCVVHLIFDKFQELGSARRAYRYLMQHQILMPIRPHHGPCAGQLEWRRPCLATIYNMLKHPIYAGAYRYGRHPVDARRKIPGRPGTGKISVPIEELAVLRRDELPAYITWEQFLANQKRLSANIASFETPGCPREGHTLLGGLLVCGHCGHRMYVTYRDKPTSARYVCRHSDAFFEASKCGTVLARVLDDFLIRQVLQVLQPASLELSLQAQQHMQRERDRLDALWQKRLERARYETERAIRQYDAAEPENRLVARELERRWEAALRAQQDLQRQYARFQQEQPMAISMQERDAIVGLAENIPSIWHANTTMAADRQEIIRYLIERIVVTIQDGTEVVDVRIHWSGGFVSQHEVIRPVGGYDYLRDYERLVTRLTELRNAGRMADEIAAQLDAEGFRSPKGRQRFNGAVIRTLMFRAGLTSGRNGSNKHLRQPNEWWMEDLAKRLAIPKPTLCRWSRNGWLIAKKLTVAGRRWVVWADAQELDRLQKLREFLRVQRGEPIPGELAAPTPMKNV